MTSDDDGDGAMDLDKKVTNRYLVVIIIIVLSRTRQNPSPFDKP